MYIIVLNLLDRDDDLSAGLLFKNYEADQNMAKNLVKRLLRVNFILTK